LRVLSQIGSALDTAHGADLVHRDVKPQNILIAASGRPFLADFGITKGSHHDGLTRTGDFVGSPSYAAPEQIEGHGLTGACDVYALAGVLFQCLTGAMPYERETDAALIHAHLSAPPPSLRERGYRVSGDVDAVFAKGMAKDPADRYESAETMVDALSSALASMPDVRLDLPAPLSALQAEPAAEEQAPAPPPKSKPGRPRAPRSMTVADRRRGQARGGTSVGAPPDRRPGARRRLVLIALAALVVAAPLAGYFAGDEDAPIARTARSGLVQLSHGDGWTVEGARAAGIDGLGLAQSLALRSSSGIRLRAGRLTSPRPGRDPVPAALRNRWKAPVAPETVRAGSFTGLRYSAALKQGGSQSLLFVPSTAGWVALACESTSVDLKTLRSTCDPVAATLRLSGAKPLAPGPDPKLARSLKAQLARLDAVRRHEKAHLASRSPAARAAAASKLAAAERATARAIRRAQAPPPDRPLVERVVRALNAEAARLDALAAAARRRDRGAYDRARRQVGSADRKLSAALRGLARGGYEIG
jgi:hypothetical protein